MLTAFNEMRRERVWHVVGGLPRLAGVPLNNLSFGSARPSLGFLQVAARLLVVSAENSNQRVGTWTWTRPGEGSGDSGILVPGASAGQGESFTGIDDWMLALLLLAPLGFLGRFVAAHSWASSHSLFWWWWECLSVLLRCAPRGGGLALPSEPPRPA